MVTCREEIEEPEESEHSEFSWKLTFHWEWYFKQLSYILYLILTLCTCDSIIKCATMNMCQRNLIWSRVQGRLLLASDMWSKIQRISVIKGKGEVSSEGTWCIRGGEKPLQCDGGGWEVGSIQVTPSLTDCVREPGLYSKTNKILIVGEGIRLS